MKSVNDNFKVYEMNEYDWWMSNSLDQARVDYMAHMGCDWEDMEDAQLMTSDELDSTFYWRNESRNIMDYCNWKCECGAMADGNCRWNGSSYGHYHGYLIGHVTMNLVGRITFKERLQEMVENGATSEIFATNEY